MDEAVKAADQANRVRVQQPPRRKPQLQLKLRHSTTTAPLENGKRPAVVVMAAAMHLLPNALSYVLMFDRVSQPTPVYPLLLCSVSHCACRRRAKWPSCSSSSSRRRNTWLLSSSCHPAAASQEQYHSAGQWPGCFGYLPTAATAGRSRSPALRNAASRRATTWPPPATAAAVTRKGWCNGSSACRPCASCRKPLPARPSSAQDARGPTAEMAAHHGMDCA